MRTHCFAAVLLIAASSACSNGSTPNPLSPSMTSIAGGAQIVGSVTTVGAASIAGVRVAVAGTSVSAPIDAQSQFTLIAVPAGSVSLRFTGPSIDATLPIGSVAESARVTLSVSLSVASAELVSASRTDGATVEVEGTVSSLPPAVAAGTLVVAGRTITTNSATRFVEGTATRAFADLRQDMRVDVRGVESGAMVVASLIELRSAVTTPPGEDAQIMGPLTSKTGTSPTLTLVVGGTTVHTSSVTEVRQRGVTLTLSALAVGQTLEVKGARQTDSSINASRITIEDESEHNASITGMLTSKTGTSPALTLVVGGTTVHTSSATEVRQSGANLDLSALTVGQTLEVEGTLQADGSIDASRITIEDGPTEIEVEFEGVVGALTGSCPSIRFTAAGRTVQADAATDFRTACTALTAGTTVKVKGMQLADATIRATRLEKK